MEDGNMETAIITHILDRQNNISRTSPHQNKLQHIVASNLDQVLLFATLKDPKTSQGFIDRFLISAEANHLPAIIAFNKADLYRNKELAKFNMLQEIYTRAGYSVFLVSMQQGMGVAELKSVLQNKVTLISGHSGVGKSTFINHIIPEQDITIKEVSKWSGKGMHTTTFAEMYDLPFGGNIIDTPGLREFGIHNVTKQELSHYFPEMRPLVQQCKFNNCLHLNEPECAVIAAMESGNLSVDRYVSYCTILDTMIEKEY